MRFSSATQTRRLPGAPRFPWKQLGIVLLALVLTAVIAIAVLNAATNLFSSKNAPAAVQPEQQLIIAPAPVVNPPAQDTKQSEPNTGAAAPPVTWPLVQVNWTPVADLSILPPAEEGFYNGTMKNSPWGGHSTREWSVYAGTILPEFGNAAASVAAAKDPQNQQIVLSGLFLTYPAHIENRRILKDAELSTRLFLSRDGEKTWQEITLPAGKFENAIVFTEEVRVLSKGNFILLFVKAAAGGYWGEWQQATIPK